MYFYCYYKLTLKLNVTLKSADSLFLFLMLYFNSLISGASANYVGHKKYYLIVLNNNSLSIGILHLLALPFNDLIDGTIEISVNWHGLILDTGNFILVSDVFSTFLLRLIR